MKKIGLVLVCIGISFFAIGQSPYYKNGISFKKLFVDYQSQNGGSLDAFKDYGHGFEIGYSRNVAPKINLYVPIKFGNASDFNAATNKFDDCYKKQFTGADLQAQYHFYSNKKNIVPYFMAGVGGVYEFDGGNTNIQIPGGLGVNIKAAPNAFINLQTEYRYALADNRNNLHHALGFTYLFGKTADAPAEEEMKKDIEKKTMDKDNDGVEDKNDLCPELAGPKDLKGCPDSDEDGVADYLDGCKDIAGLKEYNGCPDTDKDGIPDNLDECPTVSGVAENKGCPKANNTSNTSNTGTKPNDSQFRPKDSDNDGIPDSEDKCVDVPGTKANNGCPSPVNKDRDKDGVEDSKDKCPDIFGTIEGCPDKDGDGIADKDDKCPGSAGPKIFNGCPDTDNDGLDDSRDKCPNTYGTVAMSGCPEIAVEDQRTLDVAMRAVQFETGKATLKAESFTVLNQIASIMSRYPDYNLAIAGHTDSQGEDAANLLLSERRAKACYEYLITEGVDVERLKYSGFGETKPISSNETANGRALNRRVEFNLMPR
jgi:OmpA-OmpF porin, OOP family